MTPHRGRLVAYGIVVAAGFTGFWRMESTVARLDHLIADNEAQACVDDWSDYEEHTATAPLVGTALIEFTSGTVDQAEVHRFETIVDRLVDEVIIPPDCDLPEAQAQLNP